MQNLTDLPPAELASLAEAVAAEIARRDARRKNRFVLPDLLPPVTPEDVDLDELLPDGSPRWINAKTAAYEAHRSVDAIERDVKTGRIGCKIGSRLWIDRTRLRRAQ